MPDLNKATSVTRAKRGYRTVRMVLPVNVYDLLTKIGEMSFRTPDQQAAYYVNQALSDVQADAIRMAIREAEDRRNGADLQQEEIEAAAIGGAGEGAVGAAVE